MSRFDKMLMAAVMAGQGEALMRVAGKGDDAATAPSCTLITVPAGSCHSCSGGDKPAVYTNGKFGEDNLCGDDKFKPEGDACKALKTADTATVAACKPACCYKTDVTIKKADDATCKVLGPAGKQKKKTGADKDVAFTDAHLPTVNTGTPACDAKSTCGTCEAPLVGNEGWFATQCCTA